MLQKNNYVAKSIKGKIIIIPYTRKNFANILKFLNPTKYFKTALQVQLASAKLAICLKKASFGVFKSQFLQIIYSLLAMGNIHVSVSYIPFMQ